MILEDLGLPVYSMKEAGIEVEIEENGQSFIDNAIIKAKAVAACLDPLEEGIVLADDSGLEVDALHKEPGIYSARYMGEHTPYTVKNKRIIERLSGVPDERRSARFVSAIAAVLPDGRILTAQGTIEGRIGYEEKGSNGFGYDPIFYVPAYDCTTAELTPEQKNEVSHRGKALREMKKLLKNVCK